MSINSCLHPVLRILAADQADGVGLTHPLLIKAIIQNVSNARAGGVTNVPPAPSTIGLAIALFVLMLAGNMCHVHAKRIALVLGAQTRGAVSSHYLGLLNGIMRQDTDG